MIRNGKESPTVATNVRCATTPTASDFGKSSELLAFPMREAPRVSVVMPVYNAERYLSEALDSILRQTFPDFELIVIDDGSTDQSRAIIESFVKNDRRVIAHR